MPQGPPPPTPARSTGPGSQLLLRAVRPGGSPEQGMGGRTPCRPIAYTGAGRGRPQAWMSELACSRPGQGEEREQAKMEDEVNENGRGGGCL